MSEAWPVHQMGMIDSTNTEAKRRVATGFHDQWIVAEQQTAGRGRQDHQWVSPPGNVYATALFHEPGGLAVALRTPFAAALAVSDVVREHAPDADARLKWPNDVRINGRKVSGILVETGGTGADFWIAAGIGINVLAAPENLSQPVTSLIELGMAPATRLDFVLASLRRAFARRLAQARTGFSEIRQTWLARAEALGQTVHIRAGDVVVEGIFEDLEQDGALVLRLPDGARRSIRAGEVEIRRS
ncbi:MAG: biotin--[acetyl-CoA-carboxylase] ligase [Hyphomonas sp.]|nr:biotin--[acetyl-CoA-carboxylase] ligase [Hyphomonas sp.]